MRLVVTRRAQRQLDKASDWWLTHRGKAPAAFDEDVAEAFAAITANPSIYPWFNTSRGIRRMLVERIRYYIYYRVSLKDTIEVLAIWHASRRPPRI
jgi:plasmid stabilization system protein ParE